MTLTDDAMHHARALHVGVKRWFTDEPYFYHVSRVAQTVERSQEYRQLTDPQARDVLTAAAYLHDAIEDTDYTLEQARERYGSDVAAILERMTHVKGMPYIEYLRILKRMPFARLIKRADMCDNMATLPFDDERAPRLWKKYTEGIAFLATD